MYVESRKMASLILLNRNRDTDIENKRMDTKWEAGVHWEIGIAIYTLLHYV